VRAGTSVGEVSDFFEQTWMFLKTSFPQKAQKRENHLDGGFPSVLRYLRVTQRASR
jgi:hypothetical protein